MKPLAFAVPARIEMNRSVISSGLQTGLGGGSLGLCCFVVSCRGRTVNVEGMRCSACNWARCRVLCYNNERTRGSSERKAVLTAPR